MTLIAKRYFAQQPRNMAKHQFVKTSFVNEA
jgi:hypothetical protein